MKTEQNNISKFDFSLEKRDNNSMMSSWYQYISQKMFSSKSGKSHFLLTCFTSGKFWRERETERNALKIKLCIIKFYDYDIIKLRYHYFIRKAEIMTS